MKLPRVNPPIVPELSVYVSPASSTTVMVAVTTSVTFITLSAIVILEIVGEFAPDPIKLTQSRVASMVH